MRRVLVGLLVATVTGLVLGTAVAAQTVELNFWHTYNTQSPEEQILLEQVIPAFEATHPNVRVIAQGIPYGDMHQKLITSVAGGVVPDLVRMDIIWVPEFAELGALMRLDELHGFAAIRDAVLPGPLATTYWDGHYYGLPLNTNTQVITYNRAFLEEVGVSEFPTTVAGFADLTRRLTRGSGSEKRWGYALPGPWAWYFLPWVWSHGGAITDPEITRATGYLNSPQTVEALQFLIDLYEEGSAAPTLAQSGVDTWTGLGQGRYAMSQDGPWAFPSLEAQYPELQLGTALFPSGPQGETASVVGGEDLVIFAGTKHPEEAWAFARHMLSMESQMAMATTGQLPVLRAAIDEPYIQDHPYYGDFLKQLQTARPRTPHPAWARMEEVMQQAFQAAIAGHVDLQTAMDDAAAQIDALLRR